MSRALYRSLKPPSKPTIMHLVLDFDGTITQKDTMHILARIGSRHLSRTRPSTDPSPSSIWEERIVKPYISEYTAHLKSYNPPASQRKSLAQEAAWLASLSAVEQRSVARVEASGYFKGVTTKELQEVAHEAIENGDVRLRKGWGKLLLALAGWKVSILSVNWSEKFIRAVLSEAALLLKEDAESVQKIAKEMPVKANEIQGLDDPEGSSGLLNKDGEPGVRTSADKLKWLENLRQGGPGEGCERGKIVYVGDSATDLECIMAADVGVCVRDEPMGSGQKELSEALERIGVRCVSVDNLAGVKQADTVYYARDLQEVADALEAVPHHPGN